MTRELLERINEVDHRRLYADLGYGSLLDWVIKDLGFAETSALRRVKAAKQLNRVPDLAEKIESGLVNVSTLSALQSAIQKDERTTGKPVTLERNLNLINAIESKSEFSARIEIAKNFPDQSTFRESLRPNSGETFELKIQLTTEELELLKHNRDLASHVNFNASWAETIVIALKEYRKQKDPVLQKEARDTRKAKTLSHRNRIAKAKCTSAADKNRNSESEASSSKVSVKSDFQSSVVTQSLAGAVKHRVIADESSQDSSFDFERFELNRQAEGDISLAEMKRLVKVRDGNKCKFRSTSTGRTCNSPYQVQVDHIIPRALGGANTIENMRLLCRTHNLREARRWGLIARPAQSGMVRSEISF